MHRTGVQNNDPRSFHIETIEQWKRDDQHEEENGLLSVGSQCMQLILPSFSSDPNKFQSKFQVTQRWQPHDNELPSIPDDRHRNGFFRKPII